MRYTYRAAKSPAGREASPAMHHHLESLAELATVRDVTIADAVTLVRTNLPPDWDCIAHGTEIDISNRDAHRVGAIEAR